MKGRGGSSFAKATEDNGMGEKYKNEEKRN
jgi:hypothetical protein